MELQMLTASGQASKTSLSVQEMVFDLPFNEHLVHEVVVAYLAGLRQGTAAQKTRAEVRGGGIKPWKQKGTGRARAGSIRSPLWRKGGVIFAAKPRSYDVKVNKKAYRKALGTILSELRRQGRLVVVETLDIATPKTAEFIKTMTGLGLQSQESVLIVTHELTENLYYASRNLPKAYVCDVLDVDPATLVAYDKVVVTADAVKTFEEQVL
jgi:large subunit ribosomal protein L4